MSQEMFLGKVTAIAAAGFVGLMSLFNMGGRFFWASASDYIGRKPPPYMLMITRKQQTKPTTLPTASV